MSDLGMSDQEICERPGLVLIGALPPCSSEAAIATVQIAISLKDVFSITIVIADSAPPASDFAHTHGLPCLHLRNFLKDFPNYETHQRLFILGDSHDSLFAVELYQDAPGPVVATSGTLGRLLRVYCEAQADWPENYAALLDHSFGERGAVIANGLVQHRRLSTQLDSLFGTAREATQMSEGIIPFLATSDLLDKSTLSSLCHSRHVGDSDRLRIRKSFNIEADAILILFNDDGAVPEVIESIDKLDMRSPKIRFLRISGVETSLNDIIATADLLLIPGHHTLIPAITAIAAAHEKPIILSRSPGARVLTEDSCIRVSSSDALHQITAAVMALSKDETLRTWYGSNLAQSMAAHHKEESDTGLIKRLKASPAPANIAPASSHVREIAPAATGLGDDKLQEGPPRSVALIGAVPPRPLVERLFPEVDWESSPRFATSGIAKMLCAESLQFASNKLALLGYDSPLIETASEEDAKEQTAPIGFRTRSWRSIRSELKATTEALAFGCTVTGACSADVLLGNQSINDYQLSLTFSYGVEKPDAVVSRYDENCGLFWQIDPVRHMASCLLVAGMRGNYRLRLTEGDNLFVVSDAVQTSLLQKDVYAHLQSDDHGVLSFQISAIDPSNYMALESEILSKTLADSDLILEWLGHG